MSVEMASEVSAFRAARVGDHGGHILLQKAATERAMKVQEVILRAIARKTTWYPEIIGISDRHMRRWRERYEEFVYDGFVRPAASTALAQAGSTGASGAVILYVRNGIITRQP